jgi:glycosyltransferase
MSVLISVITVCYNNEKTIQHTIESVLNQTYNYIEYIIIDGGSTDKTLEIIKSYKAKFDTKGISYGWVSEKDSGISDAFNKGTKLSTGELIGFIHSDDWLEPEATEIIVQNLDNNYKVFCGNLKIYDAGYNYLKTRKSRPFLLPFGMYVMHPTVFVRRGLYSSNKFDLNLKIAMDYDILLRFRKANFKIKSINKVISNMCLGGASSNLDKMRVEEKVVMKRHLSLFLYSMARVKLFLEIILIRSLTNQTNQT